MKFLRIMLFMIAASSFVGCWAKVMYITNSTNTNIELRFRTMMVGGLEQGFSREKLAIGGKTSYSLDNIESITVGISYDPGDLKRLYHPQWIDLEMPESDVWYEITQDGSDNYKLIKGNVYENFNK